MLHWAQQLEIDSRQPRLRARIQAIILSPALGDQAYFLSVAHVGLNPREAVGLVNTCGLLVTYLDRACKTGEITLD